MTAAEVSALVSSGATVVALVTLVLKGRSWAEQRIVAREPCDARHEAVDRHAADVERKLDRVHERLDMQGRDIGEVKIIVARIDERTAIAPIFGKLDETIGHLIAMTRREGA